MEIAQLRQLLLDDWIITPKTFREADDQKVIEIANREGYGDPDPDREKREKDIETAAREMTDDDGDGLPSGRYEVGADGNLHRIGDTELLDRYHGSPQLDVISDFRASPAGHPEGGRPELNALPAVYTTEGIGVAEQYAYGASVNAVAARDKDPHLYSLALTPSEIVELGECEDDATVRLAASLGADVLECPDFGEQPETVVLDERIVHVREATNLDTGATLPVRPKSRAKKMVPIESPGERRQNKAVGPPSGVSVRPRSSPKISRERKSGGNPPKGSGKKATAGRLASATGRKGK